MSELLCSVLISSRGRFDRLLESIKSIKESATQNDHEIVVRFDNDDHQSLSRAGELSQFQNARMISGERFQGYRSICLFWKELEDAALGDWHWHFDDDMIVKGTGWDEQLRSIPDNVLVYCETHQLNNSVYEKAANTPGPIYYKNALARCGITDIGEGGPDAQIYEALVVRNGWSVRFLEGITLWHQWRESLHAS